MKIIAFLVLVVATWGSASTSADAESSSSYSRDDNSGSGDESGWVHGSSDSMESGDSFQDLDRESVSSDSNSIDPDLGSTNVSRPRLLTGVPPIAPRGAASEMLQGQDESLDASNSGSLDDSASMSSRPRVLTGTPPKLGRASLVGDDSGSADSFDNSGSQDDSATVAAKPAAFSDVPPNVAGGIPKGSLVGDSADAERSLESGIGSGDSLHSADATAAGEDVSRLDDSSSAASVEEPVGGPGANLRGAPVPAGVVDPSAISPGGPKPVVADAAVVDAVAVGPNQEKSGVTDGGSTESGSAEGSWGPGSDSMASDRSAMIMDDLSQAQLDQHTAGSRSSHASSHIGHVSDELSQLLSQLYGESVDEFAKDAKTFSHAIEIDCRSTEADMDFKVNPAKTLCPFLRENGPCGVIRHPSYVLVDTEQLCAKPCQPHINAIMESLSRRNQLPTLVDSAVFSAVTNSILLQYASNCRVGAFFIPN